MIKLILAMAILTSSAAVICAQPRTSQPGTPDDLKQVTAINITSGDPHTREIIRNRISINLPQLEVVDDPKDAQVWLVFKRERETYFKRDSTSELTATGVSNGSSDSHFVAAAEILKPTADGRFKRLSRFERSADSDQELAEQFADYFVRLYKRANRKTR